MWRCQLKAASLGVKGKGKVRQEKSFKNDLVVFNVYLNVVLYLHFIGLVSMSECTTFFIAGSAALIISC